MESSRNPKSLISVGKIIKPFGLKGEVAVEILTDFPLRFLEMEELYLVDELKSKKEIVAKIESARFHKKRVLLKIDLINSPEEGDIYRNWHFKINKKDVQKLPNDEFYIFDLIGIDVLTTEGESVGILKKVIPAGFHDVYEIHHPETGKVNLIPSIKKFVKNVDIGNKKMIIEAIEGLLDL